MSSLRHLVVRLACLHPADRNWLRAQLPPAARTRLDALLADLARLGIEDYRPLLARMDATLSARSAAHEGDAARAPWARWLLQGPGTHALETQLRLEELAGDTASTTDVPGNPPPALAAVLQRHLLTEATHERT